MKKIEARTVGRGMKGQTTQRNASEHNHDVR